MYGISPKLPLIIDDLDGPYGLTKTVREAIKQNFRNLMFTIPGERIMDVNFGVGLRRYLFENFDNDLVPRVRSQIISQVETYMSFINLHEIDISQNSTHSNRMDIFISYSIANLGESDNLLLTISNTN